MCKLRDESWTICKMMKTTVRNSAKAGVEYTGKQLSNEYGRLTSSQALD
jgi:ribulose bisphosphate carboxylase small subunit